MILSLRLFLSNSCYSQVSVSVFVFLFILFTCHSRSTFFLPYLAVPSRLHIYLIYERSPFRRENLAESLSTLYA
jgi:hypothetical protein